MTRLLTVLLAVTAFRIAASARADAKPLEEADAVDDPPTHAVDEVKPEEPFQNPELELHKTWRDVDVDLPSWKIFYCTHCGPGGNLSIPIDATDFKTKCEELFDKQGQSCVDLAEVEKIPRNQRIQSRYWKTKNIAKRDCKEFETNVEQAMTSAEIGRGIEIAVKLCEQELPQVCNTWCQTKQLMEPESNRSCLQVCLDIRPFNIGSIACVAPMEWSECLRIHKQGLVAAKRDPDLESIMRDMTLKCICVASPASGEYEGHEFCYKEKGGGQMLSTGQKWCEWHDSPSWRQLSEKWADEMEEIHGPMPLPTCTEFPRYDGK